MLPVRVRRNVAVPSFWENPFGMIDREFGRLVNRWDDGDEGLGSYPVDVHEDDNHLYVDAEMPGFQKDDVSVTLEKGILSISAERNAEEKSGEKHLSERRFTKVARSFTLPVEVDENKVDAKLVDGVLHLTLHKKEEVKPRKIEVK